VVGEYIIGLALAPISFVKYITDIPFFVVKSVIYDLPRSIYKATCGDMPKPQRDEIYLPRQQELRPVCGSDAVSPPQVVASSSALATHPISRPAMSSSATRPLPQQQAAQQTGSGLRGFTHTYSQAELATNLGAFSARPILPPNAAPQNHRIGHSGSSAESTSPIPNL
jgi:hypothetical protein